MSAGLFGQGDKVHGHDGVSLGEVNDVLCRHLRLIVLGGVLGAGAALAWVATKQPTYRATATLLLDQNRSGGGLLGELASLTSAPAAASEIQVIASRSVAEDVVAMPLGDEPAAEERRLGLTSWADDRADSPLRAVFASLTGNTVRGERPLLDVSIDAGADDRRLELRVHFDRASQVTLSMNGSAEASFGFVPGMAFDYAGLRIALRPRGAVVGRTFEVEHVPHAEALERLMNNTRVRETERNSGVIRLTYTDTDPVRAARTANALCRNYLDRNHARSERRALQTVGFITEQLDEQLASLAAAEREVVQLQAENPSAVDVSETAKALIEKLSMLELERIQLRIARAGLDEALTLLEAGDFAALSRMGPETADPMVGSYLEAIAQLSAERELLERQDASAYRAMVEQKLLEWTSDLQVVRVQLSTLRDIVARLEAGDTGVLGSLTDTTGAGRADALMASYLAQWTEVEADLRELRRDFKEELPAIQKGVAELDQLRERIATLLQGRVDGLDAQSAEYELLLSEYRGRLVGLPGSEARKIDSATKALRARTLDHLTGRRAGMEQHATSLDEEIGRVEERLSELPEEQRRLAGPLRRLESHAEIVKFLMANQKEAEITRAATVATAEFIDQAVPPRRREGPSVPVHFVLGALLGLSGAAALAFLREGADRGVFSTAELEDASGLPVFGAIPDFKRGRAKVAGAGTEFLALRDDPEGAVAEAYRSVRANLKFVLSGESELRTLAFTSCTQGEGKSTTNVDLALAFAVGGRRVLLVDADMRRPSVHRYLGIERRPGLSDVLKGGMAWRDGVKHEVAQNLDVLPAGKQPANPGDLLASEEALRLLEEVKHEYDLVIFDVPPALAVADIDGFAARLDGVLLLVKSGKLSQGVVRQAVRKLEQVGANLVGSVLNAARPTRNEQKYGYGYGYGYGSKHAA